jgi:hypothetical protein
MDAVGPEASRRLPHRRSLCGDHVEHLQQPAPTPEVLVNGDRWAIVRPRLDVQALIDADAVPDWL